jgi:hypothetical protein
MSEIKPPTPQQKRFIAAYLETWNATKAAEAAGYAQPRLGYRLLQNPRVQKAVSEALDKAAMPANEVLARLGQQAKVNLGDFLVFELAPVKDEKGKPVIDQKTGEIKKRLKLADVNWEMVQSHGYLIKELSWSRRGDPVLKLVDNQAALALLARGHGLLIDKTTNLEIDVSQLSNEQLERIANGEDPLKVVSDQSGLAESLFKQPVVTGGENGNDPGPGTS